MKICKIVLLGLVFFIFINSSLKLSAQDNIYAVLKKYENSDLLESSVTSFIETGKPKKSSFYKEITIVVENKEIINEFTEAFLKDKANAIEYDDKIEKSTLISAYYVFLSETKETTCEFSIAYDGVVTINISENNEEMKRKMKSSKLNNKNI